MKKNTKLVAVLSCTALMAIGSAMTSMAADRGWLQDNGEWVYVDSHGDKVTDTWKKSGDHWFYLNSDGVMETDNYVENGDSYSYVNGDGARVANEWHYLDIDGENGWYYFENDGKTEDNGWVSIKSNGKTYRYHFTDSKMDHGWFTDDNEKEYYLGEESQGYAHTGWQYLYEDDDSDKEEGWYYFDNNGKMLKDQEKKINGLYYSFDENGLMLDNWVSYEVSTDSSAEKYYADSDGNRADGWHYLEDMDAEDYGADTEEGWYYFKSGRAYGRDGYKATDIGNGLGLVTINGKTYCFDENGRMQTGTVEDGSGRIFYFGEEDDGVMKTGRVKVKNSDDYEDEYMYFSKKGTIGNKGASVTGVEGGYLYDNGLQVKAEDDLYEIHTVDGKDYLVKSTGKVVTSGTVKDRDAGVQYTVKKGEDGSYEITTKFLED